LKSLPAVGTGTLGLGFRVTVLAPGEDALAFKDGFVYVDDV